VKWNPFLSGALMFLGGMLLWVGAARADYTTTNPAAILIFPKVVFDSSKGIDTVIQITNTSTDTQGPVYVKCYLVRAVKADFSPATPPITTTGCLETDFFFALTPNQPIMWRLSAGKADLFVGARPILGPLDSIPSAQQDPLYGELKCIEVQDTTEKLSEANDLKGEATIETVLTATTVPIGNSIDIDGYNAIGLRAVPGHNNFDTTLVLGDVLLQSTEYGGCPNYLILDHFFDGAVEPILQESVTTNLVLVSCTEDFQLQKWPRTIVQYLVFNEFEQRFSTSRASQCYTEIGLSSIDRPTGVGTSTSIFGVGVEGTLTGQTLIRGSDPTGAGGHGLLGIAEEFHSFPVPPASPTRVHTASFGLVERGTRTGADTIKDLQQGQP
jgi:hypothetical protein